MTPSRITCSVPADELPADPEQTPEPCPECKQTEGHDEDCTLAPDPDEPTEETTAPDATAEAESGQPMTLSLQSQLTLNKKARTITGMILPYGVIAQRTSMGAVQFHAGAVRHHPDLKRVKLLIEHDQQRSVGFATDITQDERGVYATFHLPKGEAGDKALADAASGIRDGLSIGADITMQHKTPDGRITMATEATLNEVSLVSLPAFSDSRVMTVRASADTSDQVTTAPIPAAPVTASGVQVVEQAPAPFAPAPGSQAQFGLQSMIDTVHRVIKAGGNASMITAALADIVPAMDAGHGYLAPTYGKELWDARTVETPYLDALKSSEPLTSPKVVSWRWKTRPQVGPYTGDKAEIPTNVVATEPVEFEAERHAGGWDIDRIYMDLGQRDFIQAMFNAAVEDYSRKLEAAIATKLGSIASVVETSTSVTGALTKLGLVASQLGSRLSLIGFAPDVWAEFTDMKPAEVPWWLQRQGDVNLNDAKGNAGGLSFGVNFGLPAGTIQAIDKRAVQVRRPSGDPIKVQAIDLAHGGIDIGVFGYHLTEVHDARAVLTTTVTAGA